MLTDRQSTILCTAVREYIRTGTPIGSEALQERARLGWSPATVRAEFSHLEDEGFLEHPHPSAGRVPTRQGYRYYVDRVSADEPSAAAVEALRRFGPAVEEQREIIMVRELAHILARLSGTLAVVAVPHTGAHEAGLSNLFRMRELAEEETAHDVEQLLHAFEEHADELLARMAGEEPTVFINGENPMTRAERASMIVTAPTLPNGSLLLAALIGPLRMSYPKHVSILRAVHLLKSL